MNIYISTIITLLIILRSYRRQSLTNFGLFIAGITATLHALHPSPLPYTLLLVFFVLGTAATKVKREIKATLTLSSNGKSGGEGPRSAIQVLANSGVVSILILYHIYLYGPDTGSGRNKQCFGSLTAPSDLILIGIIGNYAAVTADTLSSELGILSKSRPRLITNPLRSVPPGTNGGVTFAGLLSGFGGAFVIGLTSALLLPTCTRNQTEQLASKVKVDKLAGVLSDEALRLFKGENVTLTPKWHLQKTIGLIVAVTIWGGLGSMLDSLLGAVLQASVVDRRTGKVVEGNGGLKVKTGEQHIKKSDDQKQPQQTSRFINTGLDLLDNNQINFLMASLMSVGAVMVTYTWVHVS